MRPSYLYVTMRNTELINDTLDKANITYFTLGYIVRGSLPKLLFANNLKLRG